MNDNNIAQIMVIYHKADKTYVARRENLGKFYITFSTHLRRRVSISGHAYLVTMPILRETDA